MLAARWDEIDFKGKVWTIPAARMKAGREHRVPLTGRAMQILKKLAEVRTSAFVFPGRRADGSLSSNILEGELRKMKVTGATPHGFRSAFRDWAGNMTNFPREVCEAALAHAVGNSTEQAYRRSDALEKRRALMEAWANYLEPGGSSNVVPIRAGAGVDLRNQHLAQ